MRLFDEMGMLDRFRYEIENYVRSLLAMMVRNWYKIEFSPVLFSFPFHLIPRGARVMIYGAGNVGKSYVNELKLTGYAKVAGWADQKYEDIREYHGVEVTAPTRIREKDFDVLLVAVLDEETAGEAAVGLAGMGIPEDKIIWTKPRCVI